VNGWHTTVYRGRICWIALARRTPFPRGFQVLGPDGGEFGLGQTSAEAMANLREAIEG